LGLEYNGTTDKLYARTRKGSRLEFDKEDLILAIEKSEEFECGKDGCVRALEGGQLCPKSFTSKTEFLCQRAQASKKKNKFT